MTIEQVPKDLTPLDIGGICDIDGCFEEATAWFTRLTDDPDAFLIWNFCDDHAPQD